MGDYQPGTSIVLTADFTVGGDTPADPTTVTFNVRQPDDSLLTYVYGEDDNVIRTAVGVYKCSLIPAMSGEFRYNAVGTGAVPISLPGTFTVAQSNVSPPEDPPPPPTLGPCQAWIAGEDMVGKCKIADSVDQSILDVAAIEASMALYEISGRQFPGTCERTVRPCADPCGCGWGGPSSIGYGPWNWTMNGSWGAGAWGWWSEWGDKLGCQPMSKVWLAGYPVRKILTVLIGGVELPEFDVDTGARNWRLDNRRELIRMDAPAVAPSVAATTRFWPGCQNMSLDDDQPGTFSVTYQWGVDPPQLGRDAAVEIACQFLAAFDGQNCALPAGATKVTRQGIQVERGLLANWFNPAQPTGLVHLDAFLKAYWRTRAGRRSAVWSPDIQPFGRRVGN